MGNYLHIFKRHISLISEVLPVLRGLNITPPIYQLERHIILQYCHSQVLLSFHCESKCRMVPTILIFQWKISTKQQRVKWSSADGHKNVPLNCEESEGKTTSNNLSKTANLILGGSWIKVTFTLCALILPCKHLFLMVWK